MDIKIIVVTHKEYDMPTNKIYIPICVGPNKSTIGKKYITDDSGENIAEKNQSYCELTALYWAWKNLNCDILGIVHYRRYFVEGRIKKKDYILSEEQIKNDLTLYDVIVAKHRTYFETLKDHYINCQKGKEKGAKRQLQIVGEVITEMAPDYRKVYFEHMNEKTGHMFNMFIMKREDADAYCKWLFPILFEAEKRIWQEQVAHERIMGGLAEFLLDTWLITNKKKVVEKQIVEDGYSFFKKVKFVLYRRILGKVI